MHTARQLHVDQFMVAVDGSPSDFATLLDWGPRDRLGVVVDSALGALGASLAIQLATAAFFALDHATRQARPLYADNYLFHVGGRWGDFSSFDFWPERREIFLAADPLVVLASINDHAITHLLVPDGDPVSADFVFKELEAAEDRLKLCLAYDPTGVVRDADVMISTDTVAVLQNPVATLDMRPLLRLATNPELRHLPGYEEDAVRWRDRVAQRLDEVPSPDRGPVAARLQAALSAGQLQESYRRASVAWALGRLAGRS